MDWLQIATTHWSLIKTILALIASISGLLWGMPKMIFKWKVYRVKKKILFHIEDRRNIFQDDVTVPSIALKNKELASKFKCSSKIIGQALTELNSEAVIVWDVNKGEYFYEK